MDIIQVVSKGSFGKINYGTEMESRDQKEAAASSSEETVVLGPV